MRAARIAAAVGAAALITLGCSACRDNLMGSPDSGTSPASSELSGIESTLNGVESDMNDDGSP
ncbi:hypothetical protein [Amycolatopsis sp. WQ 127309]|uniref:hypothetical protein n=1 Tax=Amycolatopsis sp. WQ 127309 TaxID=2932773 RepID=UPI001FF3C4E6|nr:hypothetical protein [Amycolatopsis sp. WQ 127309]UOZ06291.1 hypothetical protein MUY22_47100 [Amycolatopsis sp. WQ 127309]